MLVYVFRAVLLLRPHLELLNVPRQIKNGRCLLFLLETEKKTKQNDNVDRWKEPSAGQTIDSSLDSPRSVVCFSPIFTRI